MRVCRFSITADGPVRTGILRRDGVVDVHRVMPELIVAPGDVLGVLQASLAVRDRLATQALAVPSMALNSVRLLAPLPDPPKLVCAWVNYIEEGAAPPSDQPIFFGKFNSAIIGPNEPIVLPRIADRIVVEPELGVIIGRAGRHIASSAALSHIAGYTIVNDVTAFSHRLIDLIGSRGPNMMAKTFDSFAPMGPAVTTPDELGDPQSLRIRQWLNKDLMVEANTSQMVTTIADFIACLSRYMTLVPGDVIVTGSPKPLSTLKYLQPGDTVKIAIERIGTLENPVVSEAP